MCSVPDFRFPKGNASIRGHENCRIDLEGRHITDPLPTARTLCPRADYVPGLPPKGYVPGLTPPKGYVPGLTPLGLILRVALAVASVERRALLIAENGFPWVSMQPASEVGLGCSKVSLYRIDTGVMGILPRHWENYWLDNLITSSHWTNPGDFPAQILQVHWSWPVPIETLITG